MRTVPLIALFLATSDALISHIHMLVSCWWNETRTLVVDLSSLRLFRPIASSKTRIISAALSLALLVGKTVRKVARSFGGRHCFNNG
jgi:hypothetical protein